MGFIGGVLGGAGGQILGNLIGGKKGSDLGQRLGNIAGSELIPFKKGGLVKGKRGKPIKAIVHGGEYVLPVGVKPTKAQKMAVAKLQKKSKSKKM